MSSGSRCGESRRASVPSLDRGPGSGRPLATARRVRGRLPMCAACSAWRRPGPGPEVFAKTPKTPLELWDAVDYLVRTGQVRQAVPYLEQVPREPARRRHAARRSATATASGRSSGSTTTPRPAPGREPLVDDARRGHASATRPGPTGSRGSSPRLTRTREEQDYAVERLREAGPYAIPPLVKALDRPGLAPERPGADRPATWAGSTGRRSRR